MTDKQISPAAQSVLDAFTGNDTIHGLHLMTPRLAAALEAAADELKMPDDLGLYSNAYWAGYTSSATKLLDIAAELDNS